MTNAPKTDAATIPRPTFKDLWDAFVEGAKNGQKHPQASLHIINRSADGYCKLWHLNQDSEGFHVFHNLKNEVISEDELARTCTDSECIELENAAMREAIGEAYGALSALSNWRRVCDTYDEDMGHPQRDYDEEQVEMMEKIAQRPLAKLQPFLKP